MYILRLLAHLHLCYKLFTQVVTQVYAIIMQVVAIIKFMQLLSK